MHLHEHKLLSVSYSFMREPTNYWRSERRKKARESLSSYCQRGTAVGKQRTWGTGRLAGRLGSGGGSVAGVLAAGGRSGEKRHIKIFRILMNRAS